MASRLAPRLRRFGRLCDVAGRRLWRAVDRGLRSGRGHRRGLDRVQTGALLAHAPVVDQPLDDAV